MELKELYRSLIIDWENNIKNVTFPEGLFELTTQIINQRDIQWVSAASKNVDSKIMESILHELNKKNSIIENFTTVIKINPE